MKEHFEPEVANSGNHLDNCDDLSSTVYVCEELEANVSRSTDQAPHERGSVSLGLGTDKYSAKLDATSGRYLAILLIPAVGIFATVYLASGVGIVHAVGIVAVSGYTIRTLTFVASISS